MQGFLEIFFLKILKNSAFRYFQLYYLFTLSVNYKTMIDKDIKNIKHKYFYYSKAKREFTIDNSLNKI